MVRAVMEKASSTSGTRRGRNQNNIGTSHVLRKRQPHKPDRGPNVIYVSTKTHINALLERCKKLIHDQSTNEIIVYCLGAAIQRGILLVLKVCEQYPSYDMHANTATTELLDDLEPAADDADYEIQRRYNSALRIKIFRKVPLSPTVE